MTYWFWVSYVWWINSDGLKSQFIETGWNPPGQGITETQFKCWDILLCFWKYRAEKQTTFILNLIALNIKDTLFTDIASSHCNGITLIYVTKLFSFNEQYLCKLEKENENLIMSDIQLDKNRESPVHATLPPLLALIPIVSCQSPILLALYFCWKVFFLVNKYLTDFFVLYIWKLKYLQNSSCLF